MSGLLAYTILSLHAILHNNNGITHRKHRRVNSKRARQWSTAPCPSLWSFGVKPEPALVLLGWMVHYSCLLISQSICGGWADVCELGRSLSPGVIQNGVMVLNRLVVC